MTEYFSGQCLSSTGACQCSQWSDPEHAPDLLSRLCAECHPGLIWPAEVRPPTLSSTCSWCKEKETRSTCEQLWTLHSLVRQNMTTQELCLLKCIACLHRVILLLLWGFLLGLVMSSLTDICIIGKIPPFPPTFSQLCWCTLQTAQFWIPLSTAPPPPPPPNPTTFT